MTHECHSDSLLPASGWDVVVLGGGLSGVAAAVEAATAGRQTLLIERRPVLGWEVSWAHAPRLVGGAGALYDALTGRLSAVGGLCGKWCQTPLPQACSLSDRATPNMVAPKRPSTRVSDTIFRRDGRIDPAIAEIVLDEVVEAAGVAVLLYAQPIRLITEDGRAIAAVVAAKDGQRAFAARTFVDATETGLLWRQCLADDIAPEVRRGRFSVDLWCPAEIGVGTLRAAVVGRGTVPAFAAPPAGAASPGSEWPGHPLCEAPEGPTGKRTPTPFSGPGDARDVQLVPGVWSNALELAFTLDRPSAARARVILPEVLRAARSSGALPAEAIVTHSGPEVLPLDMTRLPGEAGAPHPQVANLYGAGQWLCDADDDADALAGRLLAAGAAAGGAATKAASSLPGCDQPPPAAGVAVSPPRHEAEIVVAGGGTAGALAALAAARRGRHVAVLEAGPALGGIGTSGGIHMYYCGLPGGLQDEVDERVKALAPLFGPPDRVRGFHPEAKKAALEAMLSEAGVAVHYGTMLVGVLSEAATDIARPGDKGRPVRRVTEVLTASANGSAGWAARVFVDATGDGDLAAWAGAETLFGREGDGLPHAYSLSSGRIQDGRMTVVNFDAGYVDPTDAEDLTRGRRAALRVYRRDRYTDDDRPTYIAPLIGLRSSRQIVCDYQLTLADQIGGARFPDAIAESFGHYDNHAFDYELESDAGMFWVWVLGHWHHRLGCEVPYRALLPKHVEGVLVACRGIGLTHDAHMMLRMQNDMQRLGEAAGIAAALAVETGRPPRAVDVGALQAALVESGALRPPGQPPRFLERLAEDRRQLASVAGRQALPSPDDPADLVAALEGPASSEALLVLAGPGASSEGLLASLREAALSGDETVRYRASAVLAMRGDPAGAPALIEAVRRRKAPGPQPALKPLRMTDLPWLPAVVLLGRLGHPEAVPVLVDLIEDPATPFSALIAAARALGRIGKSGDHTADRVPRPASSGPADSAVGEDPAGPDRPGYTRDRTSGVLFPDLPAAAAALQRLADRHVPDAVRVFQVSSSMPQGAGPVREDARWQLDLVIAEALAKLGVARPDLAQRHLKDPRALVRRRARAVLDRLTPVAGRAGW